MSDTTDDELRKIYRRCDISNNRTDDPLGEEAFIEAITQLFTKQLQEAEVQARHDELDRVSVLYNESMMKYHNHFEERYKYLRSQLAQDTKGGTDEDLLHGV